jgi:hypothetical protein
LNRVDDFQKRKPVKVHVAGAYSPNPVLSHKDRGVGVVEQIACKVRKFCHDLPRDLGVSLRRDEDAKAW